MRLRGHLSEPWRMLVYLAIAAIYLATRLWALDALPMFVDEGTYIGWGLQALHATTVTDTLVSVTDGKQPLLPWLMVPLLAVVPDRLIAARLIAVAAGGVGLLSIYWLARQTYGRSPALLAACLYAGAPLTFFYDRIALYDGLIAAGGLLCLATALWWRSKPTPGRAALLGLVMGLTLLTKVSAVVIAGAAPLAALLLAPGRWRQSWWVGGAYAIAGAMFGTLLLHPQAAMLFSGASRYAFTSAELMTWPVHTWRENLVALMTAIAGYLPAPLWVFFGAGLLLPIVTRDRRDGVLAGWCVLLLGSTLLANKVFYFRYYVPGAVAGLILCTRALWLTAQVLAYGATTVTNRMRWATLHQPGQPGLAEQARLSGHAALAGTSPAGAAQRGTLAPLGMIRFTASVLGKVGQLARVGPEAKAPFGTPVAVGLLCCVLLPSFALERALWLDPRTAALPSGLNSDQEQYVLSREAGWEADKVADFLLQRSADQEIVVLLSPLYGNMRSFVGAQLLYLPRVHVVFRTAEQTPLQQILALPQSDKARRIAVTGGEVYVAVSEWSSSPNAQPLVEDEKQPARLVADHPRLDLPWRHRAYLLQVPQMRQVRFSADAPQFGSQITLTGYDIESLPAPPVSSATSGSSSTSGSSGTVQRITFYWRAARPANQAYSLFVHLVDPGTDADKVAQQDGQPAGGFLPTDRWQPGETITDRRELVLPALTICRPYPLLIGWYDRQTFQRLPISGSRLPVRNDAIELERVSPAGCPG